MWVGVSAPIGIGIGIHRQGVRVPVSVIEARPESGRRMYCRAYPLGDGASCRTLPALPIFLSLRLQPRTFCFWRPCFFEAPCSPRSVWSSPTCVYHVLLSNTRSVSECSKYLLMLWMDRGFLHCAVLWVGECLGSAQCEIESFIRTVNTKHVSLGVAVRQGAPRMFVVFLLFRL